MQAANFIRVEKKHRASKSGAKATKKKENKKKKLGQSTDRHNPKAFSVANIVRTKRTQQRNLDREQKKEVVPLINREEELPPPTFIVVMGPSGVGKSTLIRSLVKIYTGQNLSDTKGPITCVAGKKRRITLFECPLDIYSMTDLSKVADLVLLMIDASYGYELETFEYLNMLQLHGFPKVVGVLSHLDNFRVSKSLQTTKKVLKHRFWTEIYKGAKMFDLSGIINGKYLKHEVKRLSLYLMRIKYRPLTWRNTHPFLVVDRVEDVTPVSAIQADPICDRDITLYGYVRGTHLKDSMRIHLIGAGDFDISSASALGDPCPLPGQQNATMSKRASLKAKDTLLYAPMANVGRVQITDKDGMYIELKNVHYTKKEHLQLGDRDGDDIGNDFGRGQGQAGSTYSTTPADLLRSMQDVKRGVDELMKDSEMSLFKGSGAVKSSEVIAEVEDPDDESEQEDEDLEDADENVSLDGDENYDQEHDSADNSETGDDDDEYDYEYDNEADQGERVQTVKPSMKAKALSNYIKRVQSDSSANLMQKVYGRNWESASTGGRYEEVSADIEDLDQDDEEELFNIKGQSSKREKYLEENDLDSNRFGSMSGSGSKQAHWESVRKLQRCFSGIALQPARSADSDESRARELLREIKNKCVTGDWGGSAKPGEIKGRVGQGRDAGDDSEEVDSGSFGDEDEVYGDFEDLQTGEKFGEITTDDSEDDDDGDENEDNMEARNEEIDRQLREINSKRKADSRGLFDIDYDSGSTHYGSDDVRGEDSGDDVGGESDKKSRRKKRGGVSTEEEEEEKLLEIAKKGQEERRQRNKLEFGDEGEGIRLRLEGFRQGVYVRLVVKRVPVEFTQNFQPHRPVIVGGLLPHESELGFIRARVKRHRWHGKILKSSDPLIFSIGWRRFQSLPVFSIEDQNDRERFLKYTPEHMHCTCVFYGPIVPPNTGILAFQKATSSSTGFRISMTGTALERQATPKVLKKLKLVGTPVKVFKNTAFITGMFSSALEVAKFEGAKLKTVSGIRGQIKKAIRDGEPGKFRASFEDKILMSDIIICRLWVPVEVKKFYNPVLSLLEAGWKGMRPIAQIRKEEQIPIPINKDSLYKPIVRLPRQFGKVNIPKKVQEALPFASKPKLERPKNPASYLAKRAVVLEPEDRKKRAMVQMLTAVAKDKTIKRKEAKALKSQANMKVKVKEKERFEAVHRDEKKRTYRDQGKETAGAAGKAKRRKME